MTHNLAEFSSQLRRLIGDSVGIRPLLCDGSPFGCQVALIGANPGTTTPFWPFWSDARGADKRGWLQAYRDQHNGRFGRSRAAIERLLPQIQCRVLELNAHAKQSARLAVLPLADRTTEVLEFVLRQVRPRIALCAGADAFRAATAIHADWPMHKIEAPHFIFWGREREADLAARVNALL